MRVKEQGPVFVQTASPKFAQTTKLALIFEFESDEMGDYLLKEWK